MQVSKSLLLAGALAVAGGFALQSTPAEARATVSIYATTAPPPLREEVVPGPRRGYVWTPGYWNWSHRHYTWQRGHFVRERHGYNWTPARWEQDGNRWRYHGGRWDH